MQPEVRIDTDFNPQDEDTRLLLKMVNRLLDKPLGNYYREGREDNGEIKKWILGVGAALTISFIVGGIVLSNQVAALTATVSERMKAQDERIARVEREQDGRRSPQP